MQEMLREVDLSHERVEYRHSTIFAKTIYGVIGECAMIEARSQKRQAEEAAEAEKSRERSRKEWAGGGTIGAILAFGAAMCYPYESPHPGKSVCPLSAPGW